jgi:uncharacterized protein YbaR (Trm112 family)
MTESAPVGVSAELLEILACPVDHGGLEVVSGGAGLRCRTCGRCYPIREGIPVMLVDEAEMPTATPGEGVAQ